MITFRTTSDYSIPLKLSVVELIDMCYYMSFPIFIWWTSNQDWFYNRYVKPEAEMEKTIPPPIWEIMYKRRLMEKEAEEQKVNVQ